MDTQVRPLDAPVSLTGESPMWHPQEAALYWCDIPGKRLHRHEPATGHHHHWSFDTEPASIAPVLGGGLLMAHRDGLWRFDPTDGRRQKLAPAPYDPRQQRFNDGKADPQGRFWVGTYWEAPVSPQQPADAALWRFAQGKLDRMASGIAASNGLAWGPDGRVLYWSDTRSHTVYALDFDGSDGSLSAQRDFARFPGKATGQPLHTYGGRPDGAAVDAEGGYWVAMFEGARLLRLSPTGQLLQEVPLPVRCPTMPCFGGPDLKTLYITTARNGRPPEELEHEPWAGRVLCMRVDVPGLPAHYARV